MPQPPTHGPSDCADLQVAGAGRVCDAIVTAEALVRSDAASAEALAWQLIQVCEASPPNDIAGRAQHVLGLARAYQGDPVGGTTHLTLAVDTFGQAGARRLEGVARCDRASIQGHQLGLTGEAIAGFEQALKIAVEVGSSQDEGRALGLMGSLFGRMGQWAESEHALRRAIELMDEKLDAHSHESACNNLRSSLALALAHTGDIERALGLLADNPAQMVNLGACDRVDHALTVGRVLLLGRRAEEAIPLLRKALADAEQANLHGPTAECLRHLALACEQVGDLRAALDTERRFRGVERRLLDEHGAQRLRALEASLQQRAQAAQHLALDRSRVLLRSIVDADDDLIFAKDERGVFVLANRAFLAYWDVLETEVVGRTSQQVFGSTALVEHALAADEAVRRTGLPSQIEQTVLSLRGDRTMITRRIAIVSPDGAQWLLGVARDVTEVRQQEEVLRRQQVFTREVIDQDTNQICVKDAQMRYVLVNAAFAQMHGVQPEALLGRRPWDVFGSTEEVNRSVAADRHVLTESRESEHEATVILAGEQRHFIAVKKPIVTADGTPGILGITREVTEVRRGEQRLREAVQTAEAANEAKSSFLANMSHEIRTPINGFMGMVDLASRTESAGDRQQYLGLARSSAQTLLTIVNDILDFSKVEAGKMTVEQVPFSLYGLIHDLTRPLALKAAEKELRLLTQVAEDLPLTPVGDPTRLRQVLDNLLGNAIKFTDRGVVMLELSALGVQGGSAQLRFAVRDTGIGISPQQQMTIFEAFTQADSSITRRFGGTGLGLAISARLVHLMGGRLELDSRVAQGACFSFVLTMPFEAPAGGPQRLRPPDAANLSVAWIEPHAAHRAWCVHMLRRWQVQVQAFASVGEALALPVAAAGHDAVFVDGSVLAAAADALPGLLRRVPNGRVFVMLAAEEPMPQVVAAALGHRAVALAKPPLPPDVVQALAGLRADHPPPSSDKAAVAPADAARPFNGLRMLLAEDNPVNQLLAVAVVERLGAELYKVDNGAEALALMQQLAFDLVLMDVQMPVLDGVEAVERWRAIEARAVPKTHLPVIAMTAHALRGDRERFLAAGFDGYVSKPFCESDLVSEAQRVLAVQVRAAR